MPDNNHEHQDRHSEDRIGAPIPDHAVVALLLRSLPELSECYQEHLEERKGELLGYIFLPDAVRELERITRDGSARKELFHRLASAIEDALARSDAAGEDLITLGLLAPE